MKASLAGRISRVGASVLYDRLFSPRAVLAQDIPASARLLTPLWLTAVLCKGIPGAKVIDFVLTGGSAGTSTRAGLRLELNAEAERAGIPDHLFTKSTPEFAQRMMLGLSGGLEGETAFYRAIRPDLDIEAPRGYHSCMNTRSWRSMIMMEDIVMTKGAHFLSSGTYIDRPNMEDMLSNIAKWHGHFWDSARLHTDLRWLRKPSVLLQQISQFVSMKERAQMAIEKFSELVPSEVKTRTDALWTALGTSFEINAKMPQTFLHGDCHVGQTYLTREGRVGYSDWQIVMQGGWAHDVTIAMVTSLTIEDRRRWERDLLRYYLDCLHAAGGAKLDFDSAWLAYRQHSIYPYFCWAYTRAGAGPLQPEMQPDQVCNDLLKRTAYAVSDLDALGAVRAT